MSIDNSLLLCTHFWDIRASLEGQVRCLTTLQRNLSVFQKTSTEIERGRPSDNILSDLSEVGQLSFAVIQMLKPTVEQASIELQVA